jgi:hypothetical protein
MLILMSLLEKQSYNRWLPSISRQRQQYWWRGWTMQKAYTGTTQGMQQLFLSGIILATHSLLEREMHLVYEPPHRSFAVTKPPVKGYAPP